MAWTEADEARFQALDRQFGQQPVAPTPQPAPDGFFPRLGKGLANAPSTIGENLANSAVGAVNFAFPQGDDWNRVNVPRPFDLAPAQTTGERIADVGSGIVSTVGELLIPGGIVTKGARLAGVGRMAPIIGDLAAGAYLGAQESPMEAAGTAAEFGLAGAATELIPSRALRVAANAAIPVAGQLLRGQDPTSTESLIQTGANAAVPLILGRRRAQPEAPAVVPDEVIPPAGRLALPGPTVAPSGQHWRQLEWRNSEPIATHPATIPAETLALPGPATAPSARPWQMLEWPHGEARTFSPSGEPIAMPPPSAPAVEPKPLLRRSQPNPVQRTIEEAINAKDIVRVGGAKGHLTRAEDGIYFKPMGNGPETRVYGDIPGDPLSSVEGLELKWKGKSMLRRSGESGSLDLSNPAVQFAAGSGAGALAGPVAFQDDDMSLGEKMARGAAAGAAIVGLGRGLMRAPQAAREAQQMGVLPKPLRRLFPQADRKLEDAATDQLRNRPSLIGRAVRTAEREFGLNRNQDVTLAAERGRGFAGQQHGSAMQAVESLKTLTPAERTAAEQFLTSPRTATEEAVLRASLPADKANAVLNIDKTKRTLQRAMSDAESDPRKKALYSATDGTWITRAYQAHLDPENWKPGAQHRTDLADYLQSHPDFKGFERWQIENAVDDYGAEVRRHAMGNEPRGMASNKIDRTLYTHKKDLTPDEWSRLGALRSDTRLTANERMALQDIVREETISPTNQQFLKSLSKNSALSKAEQDALSTIAGKKVLPKQFRNYLGEISDPIEAEVLSVNKLLKSAASAKTISELDSMGKAGTLPIFDTAGQAAAVRAAVAAGDTAKAAELQNLIRVPNTPGFGALSGKMAPRQVIDALNAHNEMWKTDGGWLGGLTNWIKRVLVPYNPSSHAAQIIQTPLMGMIARVAPWELADGAKALIQKPAIYAELQANHIIGANMSAQELQRAARDIGAAFASKSGKIASAGRKLDSAVMSVYGAPDNLVRASAYLKRKVAFLKQGMSDAEAQAAATKWVNRYTPNYGTVPNVVKKARNTPFVSPFISWTVEMTRISKNLAEDLLTGSAEDKTWAAANLGTLVAMPLMLAGAAKASLSDKDREEWERIDELSPDYAQNQIRVPMGKDKNGAFQYLNLSRLSPAGDLVSLARNILSGNASLVASENPFVGFEKSPGLNLIAEQATGRETMTGRKLMGVGDRVRAAASKVLPPLTPGIGYEGKRLQAAFTPNDEGGFGTTNPSTGRSDTPTDAVAGLFAVRTGRVKEATLLRSKKFEMNEEMRSARGELKKIMRTNASSERKAAAKKLFQERADEIKRKYRPLLQKAK